MNRVLFNDDQVAKGKEAPCEAVDDKKSYKLPSETRVAQEKLQALVTQSFSLKEELRF